MNNKEIDILLDKLASGIFSPEEEEQAKTFLHHYNMEGSSGLSDEDFFVAKAKMWDAIDLARQVKTRRLWPRIAVAASIFMAISAGVYFYTSRQIVSRNSEIANQRDIAPGKEGATLTLANGTKIGLNSAANGELAKQAGVRVTKSANGQLIYEILPSAQTENSPIAINTLSTARGETYQVRLPDGSKVWLNAASSLRYPTSFAKAETRQVTLIGEAYFEVSKDPSRHFIVTTAKQHVEVLGTHFNISSYPDEAIVRTTLLEGSVQVAKTGETSFKMLKPGQQSVLKSGKLKVEEAIAEDAIAWKDGFFIFNDEPLAEAMQKIARWYSADVVFKDEEVARISALGTISKYSQLSKVLSMMEKTGHVHFEIKGKIIIVTK